MEKVGIEEEEVAEEPEVAVAGEPPVCYRVGCALTKKKQASFLTPSFLSHALRRSISLVPVDPDLPISSQGGPFHLILHKLPSTHPYWTSHLLSFAAANPGVPVVDDPLAIARLYNRVSMLEAASDLFSSSSSAHRKEILDVPRQIVVEDGWVSADSLLGDLSFPFIAKPLVSDGRAGSHDLALVLGKEGLLKLKLPVILQEFVNHGGVLFKVYVIGNYVKCVKRRSLPDVNEGLLGYNEGFVPFSQISNAPSSPKDQITQNLITPRMPSSGFIEDAARGLSEATGLRLFNFDLIQDARVENRYLVIDINYFPGYEKIPSYEDIFTEFLCNILRKSEG